MERLTIKTQKGAALKMDDTYPNEASARTDLMRRYHVAMDRLAAYEDTGLEPEEIAALIAPPNPPLTLEELREMSWEPAWVSGDRETEIGHSGWAIIWYSRVEKYVCVWWPGTEYADIPSLNSYGDTWLAYRRKPEDGTKNG